MKTALTIAGSDSGGGAGIQADLKTFAAFGVYGMSAITALTAQNTIGVQGIFDVSPEFVYEQIKSIMEDIGTDAVKTGMLSSEKIVLTVSGAIREFNMPNVVVDPVMVAKSGDPLLAEDARQAVYNELLPLATIITPNIFEAEALLDRKIHNLEEMKDAASKLREIGCQWVVLKGGHLDIDSQAIDVVTNGKEFHLLKSPRFDTANTHGTGCTFASAAAAGLAKGMQPLEAIKKAKEYITEAIRNGLDIGQGHGPTNHLVGVSSRWQ
ncbi:MAG: bifunctional hydroxymethylpyrimidine kinase/phosphomethylpyrimidine kinase [Calditrichaeota bacterium]|nr:bifunctional hydroxymethylpyrimidine kinase/phosphomethylpyrimidine kinase [Calditrichota bacterium]RQW04022.1 MAG: bifunctional hydroxymethylpyrimidine kinase/phosphomethylpyrimidine kinase [Calditrichota bacterium]